MVGSVDALHRAFEHRGCSRLLAVGRRSLVVVAAMVAWLCAAPAVSASRPPTEAELSEITAAAERWPDALNKPKLEKVRVSTVNEVWAAAVLNPGPLGDPGSGVFKRRATGLWEMLNYADDCSVSHGIGMPVAVQRDLGTVDCPRPHHRHRKHPPQVICVEYGGRGAYRTRPHSCNFHKRGRPVAYAWLLEMRSIHWLHWGRRVALGKGKSLANMVGPVSTRVRLSAPVTVCGHTVFTRARFKFSRLGGGFGPGFALDTHFTGC